MMRMNYVPTVRFFAVVALLISYTFTGSLELRSVIYNIYVHAVNGSESFIVEYPRRTPALAYRIYTLAPFSHKT